IPNRTVKRLCADDSASTRVKVGHRQAKLLLQTERLPSKGAVLLSARFFTGSTNSTNYRTESRANSHYRHETLPPLTWPKIFILGMI
ncbi:hypothetical protein, partial [Actimicrobium sp. GrIS 1.19]|uniref:hypothetical protein n=1 Tax=Actimicrobium sp. GrIS 1.19 TaxID=3071708 RepID=UPI002E112B97